MSISALLEHTSKQEPVFRCFACMDKSEQLKHVAKLSHTLENPASQEEMDQLRKWLGQSAIEFEELYGQHNGVTLYEDSKGDATGFCMYPIDEWETYTSDMKEWYDDMEYEPDELPVGTVDALAFGEIPHSGNYFSVKLSGPDQGKIYYVDHDGGSDEPIANSLSELFAKIVSDPPQFLNELGCYTRYSDGTTKTQWIPKEYSDESTQ